MIRHLSLVLAACLCALSAAAPASAQPARTLEAFVIEANRIPMNATALVRPSTRRLMNEARDAIVEVKNEARSAREAGRTPASCPPERISMNAQQLLGFLNGIPQARRTRMSVTDGFRAWMADRHPCPG